MRGGRCGASRLLLSLPETGRLLLSGQAKLPVAHSCQRSALHHSAACTRLGSGAPGPAGGGTGSPNPPTTTALPPPAGPLLGGLCGGRRGTPGPGGGRSSGASRPPHPRACSLPFGLRPKPASVETAAGRAPAARPRGCFTSVSSLRSRHPSGPPRSPLPARGPRLRRLLPPGIWVPADHTLLPQKTGLATPSQNHPGLSQRVAVGP